VACRRVRAKRELIRVVRGTDGRLSVDLKGKAAGRGAYLCPEPGCLAKGIAEGSLAQALGPVDPDTAMRLGAELLDGMTVRTGGS
jgi:predicted RNA-binding protein YlxR (DUF448 family)